jgi:uncharacterized protein (TIGR02266 family)
MTPATHTPTFTTSHAVSTRVTEFFRLDVTLESDSHFFAGAGGDLVAGGLFIATPRALAEGTPILAQIKMAGRTLAARGTVAWRVPRGARGVEEGIGVKLEDLSAMDRRAIANFCATRPPFYFELPF